LLPVDWNSPAKRIVACHDTLTIVGGSGMSTGAVGTIKLAGGQGAGVKNMMLFEVTLPKNRVQAQAAEEPLVQVKTSRNKLSLKQFQLFVAGKPFFAPEVKGVGADAVVR
jgi:hypothetical protein